MAKKRPTLQMVAEKAGVSRGTVDRVLNNRSHVSPDVYERVMAALDETGYLTPQQVYQNSHTSFNYTPVKLGVLLPNWTGHFEYEILRGIEAARQELIDFQVEIMVKECKTDVPGEAIELLDALLAENVQGIALCTLNEPFILAKVSKLHEQNIPVVAFNSDLPDSGRLAFVGQDYNRSGRIAADLISKCIPKTEKLIAAIGNYEFDGHRTRLQGFLTRMEELGFVKEQILTIETFNDYQTTYRKVTELLNEHHDIHGIYMANRSVAGCTQAVTALGKKEEMRIVCHDISESTKRLLQEGSVDFAISQDIFRQGYLPLVLLREYLQKGKLPELTDRKSVV